jgi:3-hydroxyacyl-CoA dehydrogenase/enoyl-CoA hydratase/carnithine racemase
MATSAIAQYDSLDVEGLLAYAADEVVTHSYVRRVKLSHHGGTLALVTLDNGKDHTRPNTLGPHGLVELRETLRGLQKEAAEGAISAVAITGNPFILAAGADLSKVGDIPDWESGKKMAQLGHQTLGLLGELGVPSFCFINGLALGGGLEIALNCDYRTVSSSAAALALPEVFLGLVPGWGGAWLLPNLVGIKNALTIMIENPLKTNRTLTPSHALDLGVVDVMFGPVRFLEDSIDCVDEVLCGTRTFPRKNQPGAIERATLWPIAINQARKTLLAKIGSVASAPYAALDLMAAAARSTKAKGFAAEDEVLATLIAGDQFRASVYAFMLVQKRSKKTPGAPDKALARPLTKVGVVGAGLMARQFALQLLRRLEVPVVISDLSQDRVHNALAWIEGELITLHGKGRIHSDVLGKLRSLIHGTTTMSDFAGCDLVIEAVFEELRVKHTVFRELEGHVGPECILASNTSSLSIGDIASVLADPSRMVGIHFFNPVAVMPLVEVVATPTSSPEAVATAVSAVQKLRKTAIITSDTTGFVVNRILAKLLGEAMHAIEVGTPYEVVDAAVAPLGLPMGPFELLELVGLQVGAHVLDTHHAAFPERFFASDALHSLVSLGSIYQRDSKKKITGVTPGASALIGSGPGYSSDELRERVHAGLADEIWRMLEERVVEGPEEIDLGMILGAGWPFHMGGVTPYLDRSGASEKSRGKTFHTPPIKGVS